MASNYRSSSGGAGSSHTPPFSFLFVVNKLRIRMEQPYHPKADCWGNVLPPYNRHAYVGEEPSQVMRYQDGRITVADGHVWHRPHGPHTRGYIVGSSRPTAPQPIRYKVQTVFSCNPFLPIVAITADMTTRDTDEYHKWELLRFEHDRRRYPGVSFAICGQEGHHSQPRQYVAGSNPSWIPNLVPENYLSPYNVPDSRGLGGDLPLILALMSFWHPWGMEHGLRMEEVFHGRHALWRDGYWQADQNYRPEGYSICEDVPHGLLVHVCLDNVYNPRGSTNEAMREFEKGVIVRDNQ